MTKIPHISVLKDEVLSIFAHQQIRFFIDGTLGAGGHAESLLETHPEIESYFGFDQDPQALELASARLAPFLSQCQFHHANFVNIPKILHQFNNQIDGILLDLGVSSMQLDQAEKGFSFSKPGPLDMRMNPQQSMTAKDIINTFSEHDLADIFYNYGEETQSRKAAKAIVEARKKNSIETTLQLAQILESVLSRRGKLHAATLVFQALRIYVNQELEVLTQLLPNLLPLLKKGGKLAIISFHSLEDRIVKQFFKDAASDREKEEHIHIEPKRKAPDMKILTKKPIEASYKETKINPRSRSAKLRVAEKI